MADQCSGESNDVKFFVGADKRVFQANKFVLAYQSSVFNRMFFSDFPSENEIDISDVEPDAFEMIINCVSGREVNLDAENVADVIMQLINMICGYCAICAKLSSSTRSIRTMLWNC
jgi:BTB/POZ domain